VVPDAITYNSLIAACARGKRWQLALQMYQRMEAVGLRATPTTYNTLITACGCVASGAASRTGAGLGCLGVSTRPAGNLTRGVI
jgi:pentatricopeptide repeat protein